MSFGTQILNLNVVDSRDGSEDSSWYTYTIPIIINGGYFTSL